MTPSDDSRRDRLTHRYLPLLSLLLVIATLSMLVKMYLERPSERHERRVAAFNMALDEIPRKYVRKIDPTKLYQAAMRGMMGALDDPYSAYMSPYEMENARTQRQGEFGGIGVMVAPRNGGAVVIEVRRKSPAQRHEIGPGDIITAVDGRSGKGRPFMQFIALIRGEVGTKVELTVLDSDTGDERNIELKRERVDMDSVQWRWISDDIGYLNIRQFDRGVSDRVREALEKMVDGGKLNAVLLDVRGNAGGVLEETVTICDMFVRSGTIAALRGAERQEEEDFVADPSTVIPVNIPVAILVDRQSASASEILAGALQTLGRATVIGEKTYGKGAVNQLLGLPDGSGIIVTVAHYTVGGERRIEGKGVTPDINVGSLKIPERPMTRREGREWLEKYRSAHKKQFERAMEYLKKRVRAAKKQEENDRD